MSVLELVNVGKRYPGSPPVDALVDVNVNVDDGELVAIVGASGSGKSTMLNIIGTLDRPTSGEVFVEGVAGTELSNAGLAGLRSRRIGFIFQQFHLLDSISALDNVATGMMYQGVKPARRKSMAADALERVGLSHRMKHKTSKMSGGERQRVAIARAIVGEPAIVLADEPTGNLDSHSSGEIIELLRRLNDAGSTIIVITHDHELSLNLPRRVTIRDGRVVGDETQTTPEAADLTGDSPSVDDDDGSDSCTVWPSP